MNPLESDAMIQLRMKSAKDAFEQRRFADSLIEAEELLDNHPDHLMALMLVGDSSLELGEALGAEAAFTRILEFQPESAVALSGLAISRFELTNVEGAIESASHALEMKPLHAEAFYIRALALELSGESTQAAEDFSRASELAPDHYPIPSRPNPEDWQEVVEAAKSLLDGQIQEWLDGVEIEIVDLPPLDKLRESTPPLSPSSLALYMGTPPQRGEDPWVLKPQRIEVYGRNIARAALREGGLVGPVREGLRREAIEWLGLSAVSEAESQSD